MTRTGKNDVIRPDEALSPHKPSSLTGRSEIHNLQILRFVAALMVLVSHAQHEVLSRPYLDSFKFNPFEPIWWAGGVDIFFVISGFIMYYISRGSFAVSGASKVFVAKRLVRLIPLYWAITAAMLGVVLLLPNEIAHSHTTVAHVVTSFLFIPWTGAYGAAFPLFIAGWTLNYEMLFYAVFAFGLMFQRRWAVLYVTAMLGALALLSLVGVKSAPWSFWFDPVVLNFLYGVGISLAFEQGLRLTPLASFAVTLAGVGAMVFCQRVGWVGQIWSLRFLWAGVPAAIVVFGLTLVRDDGHPGPTRRLLVFGGDCSYSLYLTHPFFIGLIAALFRHAGLVRPWLFISASLIACVGGSALVYVFAERPVYRFLSRRLRQWLP